MSNKSYAQSQGRDHRVTLRLRDHRVTLRSGKSPAVKAQHNKSRRQFQHCSRLESYPMRLILPEIFNSTDIQLLLSLS